MGAAIEREADATRTATMAEYFMLEDLVGSLGMFYNDDSSDEQVFGFVESLALLRLLWNALCLS